MEFLLKKIYTVLSICAPFLSFYYIGTVPLISILMVIWIIFKFWNILLEAELRKPNIDLGLFILLLLIIINSAFMTLNNEIDLKYNSLINYIFFLLVTALCGRSNYEPILGYKLWKLFAVVSSIFILVQMTVFWTTGVIISGYLPFLDTIYTDDTVKMQGWDSTRYRPSSFFAEPSHYGTYVGAFLLLYLFQGKNNKIIISLLVLGIIVSVSSAGFTILFFDIILFALIKVRIRKHYNKVIPVSIIVMILCYIAINMGITNRILDHILLSDMNDSGYPSGIYQRINGFLEYTPNMNWIITNPFGQGMFELPDDNGLFFCGLMQYYLFFGIIGLSTLLMIMISWFVVANYIQKIYLLLILLLSCFGNPLFGSEPFGWYSKLYYANDRLEK
ncbi:hypothetical protein [Selenomonas ruminis]|uniref:Uncharacterized protein n=1 Tax=Selenomonas ruminis TaxID=2593411 RepID=A0A5D6WCX1_9FIRM|nr:hypothetical protein [Selenomonas sp. mPRGC5]TYZ24845.1 hypothetical protein FZ040_02060 [Selenomonas sp. mPRGC5]